MSLSSSSQDALNDFLFFMNSIPRGIFESTGKVKDDDEAAFALQLLLKEKKELELLCCKDPVQLQPLAGDCKGQEARNLEAQDYQKDTDGRLPCKVL